jgi:hypothetical protein
MDIEPEDKEAVLIREMFEEIMKLIREKQIKLESVIQRTAEQEIIQEEAFRRIYKILTEYGKKKQWL